MYGMPHFHLELLLQKYNYFGIVPHLIISLFNEPKLLFSYNSLKKLDAFLDKLNLLSCSPLDYPSNDHTHASILVLS